MIRLVIILYYIILCYLNEIISLYFFLNLFIIKNSGVKKWEENFKSTNIKNINENNNNNSGYNFSKCC
jgi:hypothetical protein